MPTERSGAAALLGPDGPLAGRLTGYEERGGQLAMAEAVERTLADDSILLCEAGTGTGKTLAYLVPALASGRRVVVSTASKALQEQIARKDLPLIQEHLGLEVEAVVIKGLANYLCLRRFGELRDGFVEGRGGRAQGAIARALPVVEAWARETTTGDRAELSALEESHPIWPLVTSSSETRIGPRCEHFDECHVTKIKRAAESARLLIVNHHLLFADLAIKGDHPGGVLPPYDVLVLDEAHRVEDVATTFFGASVSSGKVARLLDDCERSLRLHRLAEGPLPPGYLATARQRTEELFAALNVGGVRASEEGREPLPELESNANLRERYFATDDALSVLARILGEHGAVHDTLAHLGGRVTRLCDDLTSILYPGRARIGWLDRHGGGSISIASSPVDVGPMLRERLFSRGLGVVLTSATLTTGRNFDYLRGRLGLADPLDAPVEELIVEEALDHRTAALLYTPDDLPEVTEPDFVEKAAPRIVDLVRATPGGAFVLCTSVRAMRAFASELGRSLPERTRLVQGDAPKRALLETFRRTGDAVLVATMSFWEGVDVPGSALRLVVIDRLPFDVPTDPLVVARSAAIRERGGSPFAEYSVPRAAIALKQGFGRLLRTRSDRGIVAVLDRRLTSRSYGRTLLASLPPARHTRDLTEVMRFWE
ncbi:MAG: ATP-dependent DNA helicase [Deltaproteobacteria bacterium]|nr:ATP-dependent DNA helicase [Deltaproteobacteria bacterium]